MVSPDSHEPHDASPVSRTAVLDTEDSKLSLLLRIFPHHRPPQLESVLHRFAGDAMKAIEFLFSAQDASHEPSDRRLSPPGEGGPSSANEEAQLPVPAAQRVDSAGISSAAVPHPSLGPLCGPPLPVSTIASPFATSACVLSPYGALPPHLSSLVPPSNPPPPPPPSSHAGHLLNPFLRAPPDTLTSLMSSMATANPLSSGFHGPPGLTYGLQGFPLAGMAGHPGRPAFDLKWPGPPPMDYCPAPLERGIDFSIKALSRSERQL